MTAPRDKAREDAHFKVMRLIERDPHMSQRELASELGISLGATNYMLRELVEMGLIKLARFREAQDKRRYAYVLTPGGVAAKSTIARRFLARKRAEYVALKQEIDELGAELERGAKE
ncbi:MarR family EPS-associated transcriptional regulator [Erythrobacter sp.]|uniref:MarR family EPS-associated transcriptional regulator n=1 Tax=Erythrobacter sp. TaxID=1042 RepID=UPI001425BFAD|nr:MarR family EPS-associated transcriptional regulator [Erythrobacter sp.]QIQ87529.1 MAG: MarR family EPS-associated transcriptional regulator [Erythrobacter sp.]